MNRIDPLPWSSDHAPAPVERAGMRLYRCEIYNWGTFHDRVWGLDLGGNNTLLTGDIGSGKSTLVDAITTLLVPAQKISYNKAAGADARERDLRSYVLGYYKSERSEAGATARPVALRDRNAYSVILGRFRNEGFGQEITLAQVFWFKDLHGQPARFYVVADAALTIAEHFAAFGNDINSLRKRLRAMAQVEIHDSFPPYSTAFRRRFGIDNEQALQLFHQTVSMKSVGNLTDFVRQHMLEAFPVEARIEALIAHFDDLHRAHEAVLKAKMQIERLVPLVADCDEHQVLSAEISDLYGCRDALRGFFAGLKIGLLDAWLGELDLEIGRLNEQVQSLGERLRDQRGQRDDLKRSIAENGGDRIDSIPKDIAAKQITKDERISRADRYGRLARTAGLADANDADRFLGNRKTIQFEIEAANDRQADIQNSLTDETIAFRHLKGQHAELEQEIKSLSSRRSNIPGRMLVMRESLCAALGLDEAALPFAGELIEVRPEERDWEGAAERLLHGFALSLLVSDEHYPRVAEWVDRTHLGDRLVYYRVRERRAAALGDLHPEALARKLSIRPDSKFYSWLESEVATRFNHACCNVLDQFRREERAITRAGQIKVGGGRHEKDDRHRLDDRTRYVLGWSNEAKLAALKTEAESLEHKMAALATTIAKLENDRKSLRDRVVVLQQLTVFESFRDLDWKSLAIDIERLKAEQRQLEEGSDVLRVLQQQLSALEQELAQSEAQLQTTSANAARIEERRDQGLRQLQACRDALAGVNEEARSKHFPRLEQIRRAVLGINELTMEASEGSELRMRTWLHKQIDEESKKITLCRDRIISAMRAYNDTYPLETREVDPNIEAADGYRAMLAELQSDGLPRFEARFKELLNENTIREVANFQSQLARERETIRERVEKINQSLREIDYNPGRFIILEAEQTSDPEIRDFQLDLRACTEGTLTGSETAEYSEAKFLQVKRIIERFRGRDGTAELDRRWTRHVTDVRNWFSFSASERWREDGREHEHYADSGGKSGGQKEKLAYTVLAASLAYQFGLEWGETRSRSFRFVLIDEAFGRGSDESTRYGLELFQKLSLQLLIVTPLQKIHIIEPYVAAVGFVHNEGGSRSMLRNLTIEEYRAERMLRAG